MTDLEITKLCAEKKYTNVLHVSCGKLEESNGRETWVVFLSRTPDAKPWDSYQVYADEIEGRARYEEAKLKHFLGQSPEPDILAFDTDPKPKV